MIHFLQYQYSDPDPSYLSVSRKNNLAWNGSATLLFCSEKFPFVLSEIIKDEDNFIVEDDEEVDDNDENHDDDDGGDYDSDDDDDGKRWLKSRSKERYR